LNAAYLAFSAGNYAQSHRELAEARTVYHAKPRGVPPRGVWCDAFDDIVILRGKLANIEKQRKNPMRRNHHLSAGSFASGKVRVIRPFGLRKSGEDLYLVDGKALKQMRKNTGKPKLTWRRDAQDPDFLIARVGTAGAYVITNLHGVGDELEKLPVGIYALSFYRNWVGDDKTYHSSRIKSRIRGLDRAKKTAEEHYQKNASRSA
jgi:hypothetical protein